MWAGGALSRASSHGCWRLLCSRQVALASRSWPATGLSRPASLACGQSQLTSQAAQGCCIKRASLACPWNFMQLPARSSCVVPRSAAGYAAGASFPDDGRNDKQIPGETSSSAAAPSEQRSSQPAGPSASGSSSSKPTPSSLAQAKAFVLTNFLPLALSSALGLGVFMPQLGAAAAQTQLQTYVVITIFILSGLQIKRGEAMKAIQSAGSVAYGLASILLISPLLAPLSLMLPLQPPALALGLAVFVAMPTALSSGIAMTSTLGGNVAMAILLTVTSNLLAVFTVPFMLPHLLGAVGGGVSLDSLMLLKQLIIMVLIPTVVGASMRGFIPGAAAAVDANKQLVSCLSALCLAAVPWMQVSKAMLNGSEGLSILNLAAAAGCGVSLHLLMLVLNGAMAKALRLGGSSDPVQALKIQQAVVLLSSQKTLPVAVTVLTQLSAVLGDSVGLACMSAVFCHLSQILVDSFLINAYLKRFGRIGEGLSKSKAQ